MPAFLGALELAFHQNWKGLKAFVALLGISNEHNSERTVI